jgi:hypothetical protein
VLEPSFDPRAALALIAEKRVTTMMGVPATYLFLAQEPASRRRPLEPAARGRRRRADAEALLETWHARGVEIVQGYGLTEAAPNVLCLPPEDARASSASPASRTRTSTSRCATRDGALDGADGELVVRGPNVFAGYWRNARRPRGVRDGWLSTGDVAERDDEGFYRIAAGSKDMVISGGENVYPAEIEDVLHAHPAVREAAVVGVPDERWGEACARVRRPARGATRGRSCSSTAAPARALQGAERVRFVDELPRSRWQGAEGRAARLREERARERPRRRRRPPLSKRRERTRARLLEAAEAVFAELGYHDASIVKITEAGRRRAGHLLPLLREQEGHLRRARRRSNHRVRQAMTEPRRRGTTRAEMERLGSRLLPLRRRAPALYRIIRQAEFVSARDAPASTTSGSRAATSPTPSGDGGRRDRRRRSRAARLGAVGHRRARRMRLDPWDVARRAAPPGRPSDELGRISQPAPSASRTERSMSGSGLSDRPTTCPERLDDAPRSVRRAASRSSVVVEKFGLRGKHIAAPDEHVSDMAVAAADGCSRSTTSTRLESTRPLLRLDVEGLRRLAGAPVDRAPARLRERVRDRVRQRLDGDAGRAALARAPRRRARAPERPARRRLPRVVPLDYANERVALHVQLRRRRRRRAARADADRTSCSARTRSPTARSRSR